MGTGLVMGTAFEAGDLSNAGADDAGWNTAGIDEPKLKAVRIGDGEPSPTDLMGEGTLKDMTPLGDVAVSPGEGAWNELRVGEGVAIPTPSGAVTQTGV